MIEVRIDDTLRHTRVSVLIIYAGIRAGSAVLQFLDSPKVSIGK